MGKKSYQGEEMKFGVKTWIFYILRVIVCFIPLQIQKKRLLGKIVVGSLGRGHKDHPGTCTDIKFRMHNTLFGPPLVYIIAWHDIKYGDVKGVRTLSAKLVDRMVV